MLMPQSHHTFGHSGPRERVRNLRLKELPMPDLDLIKQVEEVKISPLERPAWRFAAISKRGDDRRAQSTS
jgi:hypothetical protein